MTELDTTGGMRNQHLSFVSTPGIRVTARVFSVASSNSQRRPALILLHGGGGPGKDAAAMRILSDYMARAGFLVLNMDMQFFGERAGAVLTSFTEAEKHDKLYNQPGAQLAWVMQTIKDVGRGYDLLVNTMDADPKRVGLVGFSRGAIMATVVGGADTRIAAVALILGGHFDALEKVHEAAACPANYIGRIAPRPLFMINGENDADMFRNESVLPLREAGQGSEGLRVAAHGTQHAARGVSADGELAAGEVALRGTPLLFQGSPVCAFIGRLEFARPSCGYFPASRTVLMPWDSGLSVESAARPIG